MLGCTRAITVVQKVFKIISKQISQNDLQDQILEKLRLQEICRQNFYTWWIIWGINSWMCLLEIDLILTTLCTLAHPFCDVISDNQNMKSKRLFRYDQRIFKSRHSNRKLDKMALFLILFLYIYLVWNELIDLEDYSKIKGWWNIINIIRQHLTNPNKNDIYIKWFQILTYS